MHNKKVTVLINCKDDIHVLETIKSIDFPSRVIVMLVPNKILQSKIEELGASVIEVPDNNLGKSRQMGIEDADTELCMLTDSDTLFQAGYIESCLNALKTCDFARGKISFLKSSDVQGSETVAKVRDYINNIQRRPYTPGLAFRLSVVKQLGGFDVDVAWGTDALLAEKALKAGIKYRFIGNTEIFHMPISVEHDLYAAFRIGKAKRICDMKYGFQNNLSWKWHNSWIHHILQQPYAGIIRHGGIKCGWHHARWVNAYFQGYNSSCQVPPVPGE